MAPGQGLVAGGGGAFGQVAARGGGWCSRSCPFPKGCGGGRTTRPVPVAAVRRWWRAISLPWSQGQGAHRAVGQCADAAGEGAHTRSALLPRGRPTRTRQPVARSTRVAQALAPLLADDQAAPSQFPGTTRSSIVGTPARSTACPRPGGSQPGGRAFHFCASRRRGQHDPVLLRGPSSDGVWIHV